MEPLEIVRADADVPPPRELLLLADPSWEQISRYLEKGIRYHAQSRGELCGVAVVLPLDEQHAELMNIAVSVDFQQRGIGTALLTHVIDDLTQRGYERVSVGTGNSSLEQLAFYQKGGFRIVGVVPDHFTDHYEEPIVENGIQCRDMVRLTRTLVASDPLQRDSLNPG